VTYALREDGKKIKTTRRIRKTTVKTVVNPRVAERKQWQKFGAEKGKPAGPQTDTTSVAENIVFRPTAGWKASNEEKGDDVKKKNALKDAKIKCRICSGDHWTTKCPFKDTMAPEGADAPADMGTDAQEAGSLGAGGSSYVPPHLRGRGGAGEKMGGKYERDDLATLRVTNVSEFAEEQDLRDMFSRFGHVTRVFLAKDRETGRAKGFAFVSYADRMDAAKACEKMDGCKSHKSLSWIITNDKFRRFRPSHPARRVRQEVDLGEEQKGERIHHCSLILTDRDWESHSRVFFRTCQNMQPTCINLEPKRVLRRSRCICRHWSGNLE
jgi:translation initiation factor 3 subunit G